MELVLDAETHDPNISLGKGAGWVFKDFDVLGIALKPDYEPAQFLTNIGEVRDIVKKADTIICHNAQYDIGCLHRLNIPYEDKLIIDTAILIKLYDNSLFNYGLDSLAIDILGVRKDILKLEEACKTMKLRGEPRRHMRELFRHYPDLVNEYAIKDVEITRRLYDWIIKDLYQEGLDLIPMYSTLIKALVKWRSKGVRIDKHQAIRSGDALEELYSIEMEKFSYYCPEINIGSTLQLADAFRALGLEPAKTEKGNDSVAADWRKDQDHPAIYALSNAKKYQKLKRDFIDGVIERSENDRIYPEINILGATETGRFSSSNPNIQQCYDDQTEVLTEKRGFVLFRDLHNSDKIAQWEDGEIKFVNFTNPIHYQCDHINILKSKSGHICMAVTDDHRCLRMNREGKLEVYQILDTNKEWLHLHGGIRNESRIKIFPEFIDLVFAIHSIGQIIPNRGVDFFIARPHQAQKLFAACKMIGINVQKISKFASGAIHFFISAKELPPAVWRYIDPATKDLTEKTILFARTDILDFVRRWYPDEDKKNVLIVKSQKSADCIQAMVSLSNSSCVIREFTEHGAPKFRIQLYEEFYSSTEFALVERTPYHKEVFCVTVPSSFLLIRRHGATSISGNCPSRDEISNQFVKSIFLPEENNTWYSLDFSSQEPRVQLAYAYRADCPGAEALRASFLANPKHDLHQQVADICRIERKLAKTANLAISYGMSRRATAKMLNMPLAATQEIFKKYNTLVPYLKSLKEKVEQAGYRKGYLKSMLGRRMKIDEQFKYKSLNKIVQSSSSDMTTICLVKAYEQGLPVMFSVHDSIELTSSNPNDAIEMKCIMEKSFDKWLPIPFHTDIKSGVNWGNVK